MIRVPYFLAAGLDYANADHLLAETVVHVSSPAQRKAWAGAYMTDVNAAGEFFKTGDTYGDGRGYRPARPPFLLRLILLSFSVLSRVCASRRVCGALTFPVQQCMRCTKFEHLACRRRPAVVGMWKNETTVLFKQALPRHVVEEFGGAEVLWQRYAFERQPKPSSRVAITVTLGAVNKTATRITESWWLRFHPAENDALQHSSMRLSKLGSLIDPLDVVFNGSKTLHGLDEGGVVYGRDQAHAALLVASLDVPIVKVGAGNASLDPGAPPLLGLNPAPVPNDRSPSLAAGFAFNIYNNLWATNGIQWHAVCIMNGGGIYILYHNVTYPVMEVQLYCILSLRYPYYCADPGGTHMSIATRPGPSGFAWWLSESPLPGKSIVPTLSVL